METPDPIAMAVNATAKDNVKDMVCMMKGFYPKAYSYGIINHDHTFTHTLPTLMANIMLMFVASRAVHYTLRPLKQPRIVCDLIAGILIGPSFLGQIPTYREDFLKVGANVLVLRSLAFYGILYHIFIVSVKMDPTSVLTTGRKAVMIGVGSLLAPLGIGSLAVKTLSKSIFFPGIVDSKGLKYLLLMVGSLSLTSFPVIADLLTELRLLNSELGRLALSASMLKDVAGWVFLVTFTALAQADRSVEGGWKRSTYSLLGLSAALVFFIFVFRPTMQHIGSRIPRGGRVPDGCIFVVLLLVLLTSLLTDAIGASFVMGPMMVGLFVPDGPPIGAAFVKHTEVFITDVFMPMFYASMGQLLHFEKVFSGENRDGMGWTRLLVLLVLITWVGNIVGTAAAGVYCELPPVNAFLLGLVMNSKGLIEVLTYLRFYNTEIIDDVGFAVLVLLAILSTAIAAPALDSLYNPLGVKQAAGRHMVQNLRPNAELRMVACIHNESPVPFVLNLLESLSSHGHPICAYVLHMVDLSGRAGSVLIAHKDRRGFVNVSQMEPVMNAFITFEQHKRAGELVVQPFTARAPFKTMHHDVCALGSDKNAHIVVLPFPRKGAMDAGAGRELDQQARAIVTEVLENATCTVGILAYEAFGYHVMPSPAEFRHTIGVPFWGGPDDREALAIGARMALHERVTLSVLRFILLENDGGIAEEERRLDEAALERAQEEGGEAVEVEVVEVSNVEETMAVIRTMSDKLHELLVVGRRQGPESLLEELSEWSECQELGVIGDMLASDFKHSNAILVVQRQD